MSWDVLYNFFLVGPPKGSQKGPFGEFRPISDIFSSIQALSDLWCVLQQKFCHKKDGS